MKKLTALVLALLMMVAIVAGCADTSDGTPQETTPAISGNPGEATPGGDSEGGEVVETTPAETVPEFVEEDYNEDQFLIFQRSENATSYRGFYIDSPEPIDTMSEAVFARNLAVEEKYNVVIETLQQLEPYKDIRTYLASGDVPFDLILDRRTYLGSLALEGCFYNFNDLEYVDFSKPYWDSNCAEGYEVAGKLFFMANDVSVSNLADARFLYFNRALVDRYDLEDPYKLIDNNQWTLDKFLELVRSVSTDNGDNVWDGNDVYGLCSETGDSNSNILHWLVGCGLRFIEKDSSGELLTNVYNDKTQSIMTRVADTLEGTQYALTFNNAAKGADTSGYANIYDYGRSLFASDHFLFIEGNMDISHQFRDMTSDYGVAPNPKYDTAQEEYYHKMDRFSLIWAIPKCNMDYEQLGILFEYWAYESSKTVMPAFYEITIKTKRVPDEKASAMIDVVKDSIRYDLTEIYNGEIPPVVYNGYASGNLASAWKAGQRMIQRKLDSIYTDISELE